MNRFISSMLALAAVAAVSLGSIAFAGDSSPPKQPPPVTSEAQASSSLFAISLYADYTTDSEFKDAGLWAPGVQLSAEKGPVSFRVDFAYTGLDSDVGGDSGALSASLAYTVPLVSNGLNGYVFGGGGYSFSDGGGGDVFTGHAGIGVEFRISKSVSLFGDARAQWYENGGSDPDIGLRAGTRFRF